MLLPSRQSRLRLAALSRGARESLPARIVNFIHLPLLVLRLRSGTYPRHLRFRGHESGHLETAELRRQHGTFCQDPTSTLLTALPALTAREHAKSFDFAAIVNLCTCSHSVLQAVGYALIPVLIHAVGQTTTKTPFTTHDEPTFDSSVVVFPSSLSFTLIFNAIARARTAQANSLSTTTTVHTHTP